MGEWSVRTIALGPARVRIETNSAAWDRYLTVHFGDALETPGAEPADVTIRAAWDPQPWRAAPLRAERSERFPDRLGGSIVASPLGSSWVQKLRGRRLGLAASWADGRLRMEATYRHKPMKDRLRRLIGRDESAQRLFEMTYPLVYHPVWFYLEATAGWHLLHASAVVREQGAVVFAGLEGIGKTTLALACLKTGAQLMADNLVWYGEDKIMGVPEPIRLHDGSHPLLAGAGLKPVQAGRVQKGFFSAPRAASREARPTTVILPVFGERTELVPMEPERCADRLLALNRLTGEIGQYEPFAAWMSLTHPSGDLATLRRRRLGALLGRCRCALLRVRKGEDPIPRVLAWADDTSS